jgi:hypothetical protein
MGILDGIAAPFKWLDGQYKDAAFGKGWQQRAEDEAMSRRVATAMQQAQLRKFSQTEANSDMDQRIQNMKALTPYLEGQLFTDPEAQIAPANIPMPDGISFDSLVNSVRGNARMRQAKEHALEVGTAHTEQGTTLDANRDKRAAADEARKAGREPLVQQDMRSRIDVREHPRARPTVDKPESEATFQRDYSTARQMLDLEYKEGNRDTPPSEADISNLANQIRSRRRTQMGTSTSTPTSAPSTPPSPSSSPKPAGQRSQKLYRYGGKEVPFADLPPNVQAIVKAQGL